MPNCGGNFAPAIKRCGYDGIFIKGISSKPVYLYVLNGRAELREASHLWGVDAVDAEEQLIKETGEQSRGSPDRSRRGKAFFDLRDM